MKGKYKSDIRVFKKLGKCQNYFLGSSFKCVWAGMHFSIVLSEIDKPKKYTRRWIQCQIVRQGWAFYVAKTCDRVYLG